MSDKRYISPENSSTYPTSKKDGWVGDDIRGLYIHDSKKYPVLSSEEVVVLSGLVQEGIVAADQLDNMDISLAAEEIEVLQHAKKTGLEARNQIVIANTGLVFKWVARHEGRGVDYLDLVQAGNLGLIRAAEKFDPDKGFTFGTYATTWIRSFISEEVHVSGRTIRVPSYNSAQLQKMRRIKLDHQMATGEDMTTQQIAKVMNMTEDKILDLIAMEHKVISLNMDTSPDDDHELQDFLIDSDATVVEESALDNVTEQSIVKAVHDLLAQSDIDEKAKEIICKEYGIGYDKPTSRKKLGRWETVKRLADKAMEQLTSEACQRGLAKMLE